MVGKRIFIFIIFTLIVLIVAGPCLSSQTRSGPIAILLSDSEEAYSQPAASFAAEIGELQQVDTFNLQGDPRKNPGLKAELFSSNPSLIFVLGAKAAFMAKIWTKNRQDIPVIFAMVLNWQRYNLLEGQDNMTGIKPNVSPGTQFINMTTFIPRAQKIGVVYSQQSANLVSEAQSAAELLEMELVAKSISNADDFRRAFDGISNEVDVYWVLNDPIIYGLKNISWLAGRCIKTKLACLGQSKNIAELGLVFAVNSDIVNIGIQAASMARNILLGNQTPKEIGVMSPLGTNIQINLKTARKIGLNVSQDVLGMATTVFEK